MCIKCARIVAFISTNCDFYFPEVWRLFSELWLLWTRNVCPNCDFNSNELWLLRGRIVTYNCQNCDGYSPNYDLYLPDLWRLHEQIVTFFPNSDFQFANSNREFYFPNSPIATFIYTNGDISQVAQQYRAVSARYHPMLMSIGNYRFRFRPLSLCYWGYLVSVNKKNIFMFMKNIYNQ